MSIFRKKSNKINPTTSYKKESPSKDYYNIQKGLGRDVSFEDVEKDLAIMSQIRHVKITKLENYFVCPKDKGNLQKVEGGLKCENCGEFYSVNDYGTINFLTSDMKKQFSVIDTESVSAHGAISIEKRFEDFLKSNPNSLCLDCGCGYKSKEFIENNPQVINYEIADYPSTDILGVGEMLPFADNTFDCIFSSSVLEHVKDPFTCAKEMQRVLKKGGEIICGVPFLIPYHGYPNHYYNPTYQGLENYFEGMEIISNTPSHPIFALTAIAGFWRGSLDRKSKRKFDKITLRKLAKVMKKLHSGQDNSILNNNWVSNVPEETKKLIAWGNNLIAKKK